MGKKPRTIKIYLPMYGGIPPLIWRVILLIIGIILIIIQLWCGI